MDPDIRKAILEIGAFFTQLNGRIFKQAEPERLTGAQDPRYLTRQEAASLLNVNVRTIDRYVRQGRLPKRRLGDSTRFLLADVEGLVQ